MGNNNSGQRQPKHGEGYSPYPIPHRAEPDFHTDRSINPKNLLSQSSEDDTAPVFYKPQTEEKLNFPVLPPRTVLSEKNKKLLPCVIKWNGGGKDVSVAGTFNNWQAIPMVKR